MHNTNEKHIIACGGDTKNQQCAGRWSNSSQNVKTLGTV